MIRIEVNIDDQLVEGLAALARQGEDASPIMQGLAGIMRSAAEDAFDLERDPVTGAAWPPLNAAYKKKRYEDGYTGKILSRTGRMQQTLSVRPMPPRTSSARVPGRTSSAPASKKPCPSMDATGGRSCARPCATPAASSLRAPSWAWARTTRPRCAG